MKVSIDDEAAMPAVETGAADPLLTGLIIVGGALYRMGAWTGKAAQDLYTSIDPAFRQHLAESTALGLTLVAGAKTPALELEDDNKRAVVFVHGLAGHRGNFALMQKYFGYRGRRRTISVGFDDKSSIEAMAEQLASVLREIVERNQLPKKGGIDLVAHSMGGIICRAALLKDDIPPLVRRLVTIATPHHGTELAKFLDTAKVRSLRPDSALLEALRGQVPWKSQADYPDLVCFWSRKDMLVMPAENAIVQGALAIERSEFSHNGFLIRPEAIRAIYEQLVQLEGEAP